MQKVTKEISLITIKDNRLKTRYEESVFATGDTHVVTYENATPVHDDLAAAVQRLSDHVLKISGITAESNPVRVTGYQRQNIGDTQLVTIYASLEAEGTANVAARIYIGRDEYEDIDLLLEALSRCEREVFLYIEKGKTFEGETRVALDNEDLDIIDKAA